MKKLIMLSLAVLMAIGTSFAQDKTTKSPKEIRKERQEIRKLTKKELKQQTLLARMISRLDNKKENK